MGRVMKATRLGLEAAGVLLLGEEIMGQRNKRRNHRASTSRTPAKRRSTRHAISRSKRATRRVARRTARKARSLGHKAASKLERATF